jgi:hypothetical protein
VGISDEYLCGSCIDGSLDGSIGFLCHELSEKIIVFSVSADIFPIYHSADAFHIDRDEDFEAILVFLGLQWKSQNQTNQ